MKKGIRYVLPVACVFCVTALIIFVLQSCFSTKYGFFDSLIESFIDSWNGYNFEIDDERNITLTKMRNPTEKVEIPSKILFYNVKTLDGYIDKIYLYSTTTKGMFEDNTIVKDVIVPTGIESIENNCFRNCTSLENISLPKTIKSFSFEGCSNLKQVKIDEKPDMINSLSFEACKSLETFNIPENIAENAICNKAFFKCTSLKSVNIPLNITIINVDTFNGCISLKAMDLSPNITVISESAFKNCSSLERINIYDKVEKIGNDAFEGCDKLTIYGVKGSYAEQYAKEHDIPFKEMQ